MPQRWHFYTLLKHAMIATGTWFAGWETEFSIGELERLMRGAGVRVVHRYGAWMVPGSSTARSAPRSSSKLLPPPLYPRVPLLSSLFGRWRRLWDGNRRRVRLV